MVRFISCDWGTSSFRVRLVNTADLQVVEEIKSQLGVAAAYKAFIETGQTSPVEREKYFKKILSEGIQELGEKANEDLSGLMVICSGMVSSSIGMREIAFTDLPFDVSGRNLLMDYIGASDKFSHPLLILSGVKSEFDVMRGEETQLVGIIQQVKHFSGSGLFILPGTHSKHILVEDHHVIGFTTYMTGEFFDVLSNYSVLKSSLTPDNDLSLSTNRDSFLQGVEDSGNSSLLALAFKVRINGLMKFKSLTENYHYLSGLLIGTELRMLEKSPPAPLFLCSTSNVFYQYKLTLESLGLGAEMIPDSLVDKAVVSGQMKIFNQNLNHERSIFLGSF